MGKALTYNQLVKEVASKAKVSTAEAKKYVDTTFGTVEKNLTHGVRIPGFGKFQVKKLKARQGRNPATGATIQIPARQKVAFSASKELKQKYNRR